ncbi:hypothetical protein H9L39_17244 [Fusarium oxysporum f. sp. albedinis]|nr:hypothetical protein H9L39_17244 [Fusarium oxysporum f. sp. albedinis]
MPCAPSTGLLTQVRTPIAKKSNALEHSEKLVNRAIRLLNEAQARTVLAECVGAPKWPPAFVKDKAS